MSQGQKKVQDLIQKPRREEQDKQQLLYQDEIVTISSIGLQIHKYYFPHHSKNQILFRQIKNIAMREMNDIDQTLGVDPIFFKDFNKKVDQNKDMYIEVQIEDQSARLSFAPSDPQAVFKLLETKWEESRIHEQADKKQGLKVNSLYENVHFTEEKVRKAVQLLKQHEQEEQNMHRQMDVETERCKKTEKTGNKQNTLPFQREDESQLKRGTQVKDRDSENQVRECESTKKKIKQQSNQNEMRNANKTSDYD